MPYTKEKRDQAILSGGIPLDAFPGYASGLFREFVEARGSVLKSLCWMFADRKTEILETWCRYAREQPWVWDEARAMLKDLVVREEHVPRPLEEFAIVPRPRLKRGPDCDGARNVRVEFMVRALQSEGFEPGEVVELFEKAFPSPGRRHADSTLRKRRGKGKAALGLVPGEPTEYRNQDVAGQEGDEARAVSLEYDWSKPVEAARVLLSSRWPPFAVIWELWPERREAHVALWCERAQSEAWMWDEVRALLDHAVYCQWPRPLRLNSFFSCPRPTNPSGRPRKDGRRIRLAAVAHKLEEQGQTQAVARLICVDALANEQGQSPDSASDLDESTAWKDLIFGREQLQGVLSFSPG